MLQMAVVLSSNSRRHSIAEVNMSLVFGLQLTSDAAHEFAEPELMHDTLHKQMRALRHSHSQLTRCSHGRLN